MATKRLDGSDGSATSLTHNPFARLVERRELGATSARHETPPDPESVRATTLLREPEAYRPRTVRFRLESKGQSGKVLTRITGLPRANLSPIASRLRKALGCGAVVEGDDVLLQGSLAERASRWIESAGDLRDIREEPARRVPEPPTPALSEDERKSTSGSGTKRADIRPGARVAIVLKGDQESGKLTEGIVRDILTSSPTHPRGIKVRLDTGLVGRVKIIRS